MSNVGNKNNFLSKEIIEKMQEYSGHDKKLKKMILVVQQMAGALASNEAPTTEEVDAVFVETISSHSELLEEFKKHAPPQFFLKSA